MKAYLRLNNEHHAALQAACVQSYSLQTVKPICVHGHRLACRQQSWRMQHIRHAMAQAW